MLKISQVCLLSLLNATVTKPAVNLLKNTDRIISVFKTGKSHVLALLNCTQMYNSIYNKGYRVVVLTNFKHFSDLKSNIQMAKISYFIFSSANMCKAFENNIRPICSS